MKKKITLISSIFMMTFYSSAQPVITGLNVVPVGGKTINYPIPGNITHLASSPNQVWDYSTIPYDSSTFYFENIGYDALSQEIQDTFPDGNLANALYMNGSFVTNLVFRTEPNQLLYLGIGNSRFPVADTQWVFPHSYQETHAGNTYDSYGTLITPFGTFNNVVRMRENQDSLHKYDFYQLEPNYILLMEYIMDPQTSIMTTKMFFNTDLGPAGLSNKSNVLDNSILYPNPIQDKFIIEIENFENTNAEITSIKGELIQAFTLNSNKTLVKTDKFNAGVYILKLENDNGVSYKRIVKD